MQCVERHAFFGHVRQLQRKDLRDVQQGENPGQGLELPQHPFFDFQIDPPQRCGQKIFAQPSLQIKVAAHGAGNQAAVLEHLLIDGGGIEVLQMT